MGRHLQAGSTNMAHRAERVGCVATVSVDRSSLAAAIHSILDLLASEASPNPPIAHTIAGPDETIHPDAIPLGRKRLASVLKPGEFGLVLLHTQCGLLTIHVGSQEEPPESRTSILEVHVAAHTESNRRRFEEEFDVPAFVECVADCGSLIFAGADLHAFDWQRDRLLPDQRGSRSWTHERYLTSALGYFGEMWFGQDLYARLGTAPGQVTIGTTRKTDLNGSLIHHILLAEDATNEAAILRALPAVRSWMRPILPGWILSEAFPTTPTRSLEGPPCDPGFAGLLNLLSKDAPLPSWHQTSEVQAVFEIADASVLFNSEVLSISIACHSGSGTTLERRTQAMVDAVTRGMREGWIPTSAIGVTTSLQGDRLVVTVRCEPPSMVLREFLFVRLADSDSAVSAIVSEP